MAGLTQELRAMGDAWHTIEALSPDEQQRVLVWLHHRVEQDKRKMEAALYQARDARSGQLGGIQGAPRPGY